MSDYFDKDPQNPREGGDGEGGKWPEVIGGGSSNIGGGTGGSGIKHLSDPHNPRNGGDHDSIIPVIWKGGDSGYISGDDQYDASGVWDISDGGGWVIDGGEGLDHEWYINGGEGGYISDNDHYDAAVEYGGRTKEWLGQDRIGRTSEDISDGSGWVIEGDGIGGKMDPVCWIDPTWLSGHTNSFSGDWGT